MNSNQKSDSRWTWGEQTFVVTFITLFAVIPFFNPDLYPFTAMPMFSDSKRDYWYFTVTDAAGKRLPETRLGLGNFDSINPAPRIGVKPPQSIFERWSSFIQGNEHQQGLMIQEQVRDVTKKDPVSAKLLEAATYPLSVQLMHIFISQEHGNVRREMVTNWQIEAIN